MNANRARHRSHHRTLLDEPIRRGRGTEMLDALGREIAVVDKERFAGCLACTRCYGAPVGHAILAAPDYCEPCGRPISEQAIALAESVLAAALRNTLAAAVSPVRP